MKIAILHMTMGLTNRGSEVVVDHQANYLAKNHEVLVVQSGPVIPKKYKSVRVMPLTIAPPSSPRNIIDKLLFRLRVDKESEAVINFTRAAIPKLQKFLPDIIICINGSLQLKIVRSFFQNTKLVAFGHAGIGHHDTALLRAKPNLFIALSDTAFSWAKKISSGATKVVYIPNPITDTKKTSSVKLDLPSPVVLTVSSLSSYKNVTDVISSVAETNFSYLLIGDGEESEAVTKQLSTLPGDFKWIKKVSHEAIASYYASADIFCFIPDSQEAFGMVYLEAMAAGLPIIASDDPIRRSLIGNQGIFVDPSDHNAIVAALSKAKSMGRVNYSKEIEPYKIATVVKQIEEEFHALIT